MLQLAFVDFVYVVYAYMRLQIYKVRGSARQV
jgi:hypothetical protein